MTICLRYANCQEEAEDMMQEGFLSIFTSITQFKGDGAFEGWLYKIMVNACLRVIRKKRIEITSSTSETDLQYVSIEAYTYSSIAEADLLKLINALPTGYKLVFNLSIIEGYSHEEIAELLQIQPSTSRSQLVKARKLLQQQIIELQKIAV